MQFRLSVNVLNNLKSVAHQRHLILTANSWLCVSNADRRTNTRWQHILR